MQKKRRYPPSYIRYQIENPAVTVHLTRKLKDTLDAVRSEKSYAKFIKELLDEKLDLTEEIKKLPVTQLLMGYENGFLEAYRRYGRLDRCKKCGIDVFPLHRDGKCYKCHGLHYTGPEFTEIKEKPNIMSEQYDLVNEGFSSPEKEAFQAGERSGEDVAETRALKREFLRIPCKMCGKPMTFSCDDKEWNNYKRVLKEAFREYRHEKCG